jgi:hypothetical protein
MSFPRLNLASRALSLSSSRTVQFGTGFTRNTVPCVPRWIRLQTTKLTTPAVGMTKERASGATHAHTPTDLDMLASMVTVTPRAVVRYQPVPAHTTWPGLPLTISGQHVCSVLQHGVALAYAILTIHRKHLLQGVLACSMHS